MLDYYNLDKEKDEDREKIQEIYEFYESSCKDYEDDFKEQLENVKNCSAQQFLQMIGVNDNEYMKSIHGMLPEANRGLFIKKAAKTNMTKTNYAETYFVDTKNNFALMQNASDVLNKPSKDIDLDKLGLIHGDIEFNTANTINDRVVDYGGIMTKAFYEKLMKQQEEMLNNI